MKNTTERENHDVYEIVTERILELLESGVVPWNKEWTTDGREPMNLVSKKPYRGVNVWLLGCTGYASPFWVSYKQAAELGGTVRKGEKSSLVVYWKILDTVDKVTQEKKKVPLLRYYRVFNVAQCDGLKVPEVEGQTKINFSPIAEAEKVVAEMPLRPKIEHKEQRAYYARQFDLVNMPDKETFNKEESYYSTLFHELTHATGHASRLGRLQNDVSGYGSTSYAKEELIAEMSASYLCAKCGIVDRVIDNSAAYINGWIQKIKGDKKLVVGAASKAQEATEFILGTLPPKKD